MLTRLQARGAFIIHSHEECSVGPDLVVRVRVHDCLCELYPRDCPLLEALEDGNEETGVVVIGDAARLRVSGDD